MLLHSAIYPSSCLSPNSFYHYIIPFTKQWKTLRFIYILWKKYLILLKLITSPSPHLLIWILLMSVWGVNISPLLACVTSCDFAVIVGLNKKRNWKMFESLISIFKYSGMPDSWPVIYFRIICSCFLCYIVDHFTRMIIEPETLTYFKPAWLLRAAYY